MPSWWCNIKRVLIKYSRRHPILHYTRRCLSQDYMANSARNGGSMRVLVRCVPGEDNNLTITLLLNGSIHKLQRLKEEQLAKTLTRISLTIVKIQKKESRKNHKNHSNPLEALPTALLFDNEDRDPISLDTPNMIAWKEGAWLHVNEVRYKVLVNPPSVRTLEMISSYLIVGSPTIPQVSLEFADSSLTRWRWWHVTDPLKMFLDNDNLHKSSLDTTLLPSLPSDSQCIHSGMIYYPTSNDIGMRLLIECIPVNSDGGCGHPTYICTNSILPEPNLDPLIRRQLQTPSPLQYPQTLRLVSYNILATSYSISDYASQTLYPYCQEQALQPDYRMGLVVREVIGYCPDIVCMQEVSLKWFDNYLLPAFKERGFDGHIALKTGKMAEGEAIIYNTSKYDFIQTFKISLSQFLQQDTECSDLLKELKKAPLVIKNVIKKHTILQLSILKCKRHRNRFILVGNTHLCYRATEGHLRLIQCIVCMRAFRRVLRDFKTGFPDDDQPDVAILFCGDFNSCPCTSGYEFLTKGHVDYTHCEWTQYKYRLIARCGCCEVEPSQAAYIINYDYDDETMDQGLVEDAIQKGPSSLAPIVEDDFRGLNVTHEFSLQDSCGILPYSHYIGNFKALLDYVFSDQTLLSVEKVIGLPDHSDIIAETALPSTVFPSDHLALVCDLKWKI